MALAGLLQALMGDPAKDRSPLVVDITGSIGQRDKERERREREEMAQERRRTQARIQAEREPLPPALRLTPEEQALTAEDNAYLANVEAARQEIARDNALIDAGFPPFAVRPGFNLGDPDGRYTDPNTVMPPPAPAATQKPKPTPATLSPVTTPKRDLQMADPEVQRMLEAMNAPPLKSVSGGPTSGRGAVQDPGFLSRAGRGILDYLSDPVNRKSLAIGFNAMTLNPDRGFQAAMQSQIENIQEQRLAAKAGNQTADYLERQGLIAEAELIRANPELASDILASTTLGASSDYQKKLEEIVAQDDRDLVNNATDQIANREKTISTLQKLENDEAFTGALVPIQTTLGRVLESLGVEATDEGALGEFLQKSSNTELLRARLGRTVFEAIGELGIGARGLDTPAERKFLIEVMAGTPESTKAFLQELLQDRLRQQEISIEEYNKALKEGRLDRFQQFARRDLSPIQLEPYGDEFAEFEIVN